MVKVNVVFANKGSGDVCAVSRVPCLGEIVCLAGDEGKVIEVVHMANADPTNQVVARVLVK